MKIFQLQTLQYNNEFIYLIVQIPQRKRINIQIKKFKFSFNKQTNLHNQQKITSIHTNNSNNYNNIHNKRE